MEKASVISAMMTAGSSAKPEMKMKPNPIMMSITLWSTGPAPRSLNSGNSTDVTTIIPATRQAARKPKKMTKRRPISATAINPETESSNDEQAQNIRGRQATARWPRFEVPGLDEVRQSLPLQAVSWYFMEQPNVGKNQITSRSKFDRLCELLRCVFAYEIA